jgi:hypothetical protein
MTTDFGNLSSSIVSHIPGTGSTQLGKAQGQVTGSSDVGLTPLFEVQFVPLTGQADAKYATPRVDDKHRIWAHVTADSAITASISNIPHTRSINTTTSSTDIGVASLFEMQTAPTASAGANAQFEFARVDSYQRLWVRPVPANLFTVTMTLSASLTYGTSSLLADTQAIASAVQEAGGSAILDSIFVLDEDAQGASFYLYISSTNTSFGTEGSVPNISDANLRNVVAAVGISTGDYVTISGAKVVNLSGLSMPVKAAAGDSNLYVAIVNGTTNTPVYTATGVQVKFGFKYQ